MPRINLAFEMRQRFLERRAPAFRFDQFHISKAVIALARKTGRHMLMLFAQHIDGEMRRFLENRQRVRLLVEAPQNKRRIERDGRKGINGDANRWPPARAGGDDRNAGREPSKRVTELARL